MNPTRIGNVSSNASRVDRATQASPLRPERNRGSVLEVTLAPELSPGFEREFRGSMRMTATPREQAAEAMVSFAQQFADKAGDKKAFHKLLQRSFGPNYDQGQAEQYRQQALKGDFDWLPPVRVVESTVLGGAHGAFNAEEGVIYLNKDVLKDGKLAADIYAEEFGHFLDTKLNRADSKGDEGELFRRLLGGEKLSKGQIAAIRAENDHGVITVDGKEVAVEFWNPFKAVANAVKSIAKGIQKVVGKVVQGVAAGLGKLGGAIGGKFGRKLGKGLGGILTGTWNATVGVVRNLGEGIGDSFKGLRQLLRGDFKGGFETITQSFVKVIIQTPVDAFLMIGGKVVSAIQMVLGVEPEGRKLTSTEIAELRKVYGNSIDYRKIEVKEGDSGLFSGQGRPFVHGNTIYLNGREPDLDLLIHESAHVWQHQNGGTDYMTEALWSQYKGKGYDWAQSVPGTPWEDLEPEQQAEFLEVAYRYGAMNDANYNFMYDVDSDGRAEDLSDYLHTALQQIRAGEGAP
jgi:hypothetical protein